MSKIKVLLISLVLLLIPSVCNAAVIDNPVVDSVNSILTISGTIEGASIYDDVMITVLRPGKKHSDLTAFTKDKINEVYAGFAQFVLKDDTGRYEVKVKADKVGDYIITVSSPSLSEPAIYTYFFATLKDKQNLVEDIVGCADSTALKTLLDLENENSTPLKTLGVKYASVSGVSADGLATVLFALNKETVPTKENVDIAVSNIADAVMIEKLNEGKITEIKQENKDIGENELYVDDLKVKEVYSTIFKTKLTEDEQKKLSTTLSGKDLTDFASVNNAFAEAVILSMINYKESWSNVLYPAENCNDFIGISEDIMDMYEDIDNTGDVADELNMTFSSIEDYKNEFEDAVKKIYEEENDDSDDKKPSSGGGGGGGAISTPVIVQPPVSAEPVQVPEASAKFSDVSDEHWAYSYITDLAGKNIVSGFEDGTFKPDASVKREEFIKMLVEALKIEGTSDKQFSDVSESAWYKDYVKTAVGAGIINGISETEFGSGIELTRADMAVMVVRALGIDKTEEPDAFNDDNDIPDYAKESVYILKSNGILSGNENGNFEPQRSLTRAECAKIISLIM